MGGGLEEGGGGEHLTLNASHLIKSAPRRGKNGACFFEKCDSQYEAFGGVPGRVDLTGNSQKHRVIRQLTSPSQKEFRDGGSFLGCFDFFLFTVTHLACVLKSNTRY